MGVLIKNVLAAPGAGELFSTHPEGELGAIIRCCTATDPRERYESSGALKADLRAYRLRRPVNAYAGGWPYFARKFAARQRVLVGSAVIVLASLGAGLTFSLWQYGVAQREAVRAQAAFSFVTSLFDRIHPDVAGEQDVTLRTLMDEASGRLGREFAEAPDVRNDLRQLIARGYHGLGQYDEAYALHEAVLQDWQARLDPPHPELARALTFMANQHRARGEYEVAIEHFREALGQLEPLDMAESSLASDAWTGLGKSLLRLNRPGGVEATRRADEIIAQVRPPNPSDRARSLGNLAAALRSTGEIREAVAVSERALAFARDAGERNAPSIIATRCNLALDYMNLGRLDQARTTTLACIAQNTRRLGAGHPELVANYNNLGAIELSQGEVLAAREALDHAVRLASTSLPENAIQRLAARINLAQAQWQGGQADRAEQVLRAVLPHAAESFGEAHPATNRVRSILGRVRLERGDAADAEQMISQSLAPLTPQWRADATLWLAEACLALDRFDDARRWARESLDIRSDNPRFTDWQIAEARFVLARTNGDDAGQSAAQAAFADLPAVHYRAPQGNRP